MIEQMVLAEANNNMLVKIKSIDAGKGAKKRLTAIGLHPDDVVQVVSNMGFGPILLKVISNGNAKIAIGRGLAEKIEVESAT